MSSSASSSSRRRSRPLVVGSVLAAAAAALCCWPAPAAPQTKLADHTPRGATDSLPADGPTTSPPDRSAAPAAATATASDPATAPPRTFLEIYHDLVAFFDAGRTAATDDAERARAVV
jgi:hypothetical protein